MTVTHGCQVRNSHVFFAWAGHWMTQDFVVSPPLSKEGARGVVLVIKQSRTNYTQNPLLTSPLEKGEGAPASDRSTNQNPSPFDSYGKISGRPLNRS